MGGCDAFVLLWPKQWGPKIIVREASSKGYFSRKDVEPPSSKYSSSLDPCNLNLSTSSWSHGLPVKHSLVELENLGSIPALIFLCLFGNKVVGKNLERDILKLCSSILMVYGVKTLAEASVDKLVSRVQQKVAGSIPISRKALFT